LDLKMASNRIVYFHGGPGFNGNPERLLLTEGYRSRGVDLRVWDEPSSLRPEGAPFVEAGAFENYLNCAEAFFLANSSDGPVTVMGHSFGAFAVCELARRHPERIGRIVLIATDLALPVTDRNAFELCHKDFAAQGDDRAAAMARVLSNYSGNWDANAEEGYGVAAQHPGYFAHYWRNQERMMAFLQGYSAPAYTIDVQAFLSVRRSVGKLPAFRSTIPVTAIFGAHEVVVSKEAELKILRERFERLEVMDFAESAHYPHIEEANRVLRLLEQPPECRTAEA
jgi:pimeloyl-ACP methyl ester carboxylesterase